MAKRTTSTNEQPNMNEEEVELEDELETPADPAPEEVTEEDLEDEPVEEVDDPAPVRAREDNELLNRYKAEKARGDALVQVLEQLRQTQPQQITRPVEVSDPDSDLDENGKKWARFVRERAAGEIDRRVKEYITQNVEPLQRESFIMKDMMDDNETRRRHRDFHLYEDEVKELRARWFQERGVVAPREVAYFYIKGTKAGATAAQTRTQTSRAAAKTGATVSNKQPARKVTPRGPVTLDDISKMSEADAEKWLIDNKATF